MNESGSVRPVGKRLKSVGFYERKMREATSKFELVDGGRLGEEPDADLAERYDLPDGVVRRIRNSLSIAPYSDKQNKKKIIAGHPDLGLVNDSEIAGEVGCARSFVAEVRRSLGILSLSLKLQEERRDLVLSQPDIAVVSAGEIGDRCGVSKGLVNKVRRDAGIEVNVPRGVHGRYRKPQMNVELSRMINNWRR